MRLMGASVLALLLPVALQAQAATQHWCAPWAPQGDSVRAVAARYHPEVFRPDVARESMLVGLIFDRYCRVVEHATGRRSTDSLSTDSALVIVFPWYSRQAFDGNAVTPATPPWTPGSPWIVWAIKTRDG